MPEISVRQESGSKGKSEPSVAELAAMDGYLCAYGGGGVLRWRAGWQRDHVVPQLLGGSWNVRNLVLSCGSCNSRKSSRDLFAWYEELRAKRALWMHPYLLSVMVDVALASDLELPETRQPTTDGPTMLRDALDGLLGILEDYYETGKPIGYLR